MKYNGFYFWMFKSPMKKVLAEKYGKEYAADIMKKSKKVYRQPCRNDAPLALSYQVVFCKDRLKYRQGQGGEQKECRQIRQMVHTGKGEAIP